MFAGIRGLLCSGAFMGVREAAVNPVEMLAPSTVDGSAAVSCAAKIALDCDRNNPGRYRAM